MPAHEIPLPAERALSVDAVHADSPFAVHVVAHTHWDREWYHPATRFQARLVALVDALLEAPPDAAAPFLLDGQTVVLSDYLDIRPERSAQVARALASGALEAGPWYVLGDTLIPSAEAIVRNLEAGKRWLRRLGAVAPRVAYCPDTFGHPAALPLIAQGFGCEVAIVWRGFGGASFPAADTCWWYGPDGARVLLYHLPPDGYEFGSALPTDLSEATTRWRHVAATLRARNRTGTALLMSGADHHAAPPSLSLGIQRLEAAARDDGARVIRSGLSRAAGALVQAAHTMDTKETALPDVHGELRDSYGYAWTLPGTLGTRAHLKRANARLERTLLRDVEPWIALAWLHGVSAVHAVAADGSLTLAQLPVLAQHTWETLLRTHPHDTLCGCSVDAVASDMRARQRRVAASAVELRDASLACALSHDRVLARARAVSTAPLTVVRNRTARAREGIVELHLLETLGDVRVGPGRAGVSVPGAPDTHAAPAFGEGPMQIIAQRTKHVRRESPQHYPDDDLVREHHVVAWVPSVPAFGVRVVGPADHSTAFVPAPVTVNESSDRIELDNGILQIIATPNGLSLAHGMRRLPDVLGLETRIDAGDSYTPSLRGAPESLRLDTVRVGARGPLRASLHLGWVWRTANERIRVWTEIILDADATHVRCDVRGSNRRRDHRLQLVWRTDVSAMLVMADAAFGPVVRTPLQAVEDALPFEVPPRTMPLHRWLTVCDDARGVTLVSDGLAEGEAGDGRLAVTLVRSIGELSRDTLPERPGHAGWPSPIPAAQCRGRFAARVGLHVHGPWNAATQQAVEDTADALLLPLVGESWRDLAGMPRELAGPTLDGDGLVASAVHVHDGGAALVLRAANMLPQKARGQWTLPRVSPWQSRRVRLDGTPQGEWIATVGTIAFEAGPREVVTIEVRRSD